MSIMRQMKDKAIAMAEAMAERARTPQDIEAARQRLVAEIQGGRVPAYVGVPLVQDLTQRLTQAKAQMAQQVAGMGVPQAPQGAPIAQQVIQQAQQPAGVEALPSNLPQSYAPGGLVAFADGGEVERYQNTGLVGSMGPRPVLSAVNPNAEFVDFLRKMQIPTSEYARLSPADQKNIMDMFRSQASVAQTAAPSAAPSAASPVTQTAARGFGSRVLGALTSPFAVVGTTGLDLSRGAANYLQGLSPEQREQLTADIGSDTGFAAAILNAAQPSAKNPTINPIMESNRRVLGPIPAEEGVGIEAERARNMALVNAPPAPPAASAVPSVAMPKLTLPKFTPTAAPELTNLEGIIKNSPKEAKQASEDAIKEAQAKLEEFDKPGFEAREARLGKREAALEKATAMDRALNLINLGFGVAGSKERTLAGALSNEGRQGIQTLIQGEAANRAAKNRLEDARDNFEQQKVAAKKGNYQAAQAAGQRAADDVRAYTQLNLQAAQAGNSQAQQRWQAENTVGIQNAQLQQQGILGLAQLQQQASATNAQLTLGREKLNILKDQVAAGNKRAEAALAGAQQKAYAAFQSSPAYRQAQEQAKKMDPIQAQRFMQQEWLKYSANAIPSLLGGSDMGIPSFSDLYKATE